VAAARTGTALSGPNSLFVTDVIGAFQCNSAGQDDMPRPLLTSHDSILSHRALLSSVRPITANSQGYADRAVAPCACCIRTTTLQFHCDRSMQRLSSLFAGSPPVMDSSSQQFRSTSSRQGNWPYAPSADAQMQHSTGPSSSSSPASQTAASRVPARSGGLVKAMEQVLDQIRHMKGVRDIWEVRGPHYQRSSMHQLLIRELLQ
jgi:hypothetical protein